MDKERLNQYRLLVKEKPKVERAIERLNERLDNVPVVSGKVMKSSDDFPYIEEHITVQMSEPKAATEIKNQIRIKEARLDQIEAETTEIERFIASIPDSRDRQIFELTFIDGKKQREVAEDVGYSRGRISQIISEYLKD